MNKIKSIKLILATIMLLSLSFCFVACSSVDSFENTSAPEYEFDYESLSETNYDSNMSIDGKLNEAEWANVIAYTNVKADENNVIADILLKTIMTEKGLYIGAVANDKNIRYNRKYSDSNTWFKFYITSEDNIINNAGVVKAFQLDAETVRSQSASKSASEVVIDGELNSNNTKSMTAELFVSWEELNIDVSIYDNKIPNAVKIYPIYRILANEQGTTFNDLYAAWGSAYHPGTYFKFDANGYANDDAENAKFGNLASGASKSGGWDISKESQGQVTSTAPHIQAIYDRSNSSTNFAFSADITLNHAFTDPYPNVGIMVYKDNTKFRAMLLSAYNNNLTAGTNVDKKFKTATINRLTYFPSGLWHMEAPIREVPGIDFSSDSINLKIIKSDMMLYYYVNDVFAFGEECSYLNGDATVGLYSHNISATYSNMTFVNYDDNTEALNELLNEDISLVNIENVNGGYLECDSQFVRHGEDLVLKLSPNYNQYLTSITVNGQEKYEEYKNLIAIDGTITIKNVNESIDIVATFAKENSVINVPFSANDGTENVDATIHIITKDNPLLRYEVYYTNREDNINIPLPKKGSEANPSGEYVAIVGDSAYSATQVSFVADENSSEVAVEVKESMFGDCSDGTTTFAPSDTGFYYGDASNAKLTVYGSGNGLVAQFKDSLSSSAFVQFTVSNTTPEGQKVDPWSMIGLSVRNGNDHVKFGLFSNRISYYKNGTSRVDILNAFSNNIYTDKTKTVEVALVRVDGHYLAFEIIDGEYKLVGEFTGDDATVKGQAVYGITINVGNAPTSTFELDNIIAKFGEDAVNKLKEVVGGLDILKIDDFNLEVGEEKAITLVFSINSLISDVVYTTTSDIISIENNTITALSEGEATVTATSDYATIDFTVTVSAISYGQLNITAPTAIYSNYSAKELTTTFTKPEYASDITYEVDSNFAEKVIIENGTIKAVGLFDGVQIVNIKATTTYHETSFNVSVSNYNGEKTNGQSMDIEARVQSLEKVWKDAGSQENSTLFIGDSFFDTRWFFNNFDDIYFGKNAYAFGIASSTTANWDIVCERLVYPMNPKNIVLHIGTNDLFGYATTKEQVLTDIKDLINELSAKLPNTNIYYFNIEPRIETDQNVIDSNIEAKFVNEEIEKYAQTISKLTVINSNAFCYNDDNSINSNFYKDTIHPADESYIKYVNALEDAGCVIEKSANGNYVWINIEDSTNGQLLVDKTVITNGDDLVVKIVPNANYYLSGLTINGQDKFAEIKDTIEITGQFTLSNLTEDTTILAEFSIIETDRFNQAFQINGSDTFDGEIYIQDKTNKNLVFVLNNTLEILLPSGEYKAKIVSRNATTKEYDFVVSEEFIHRIALSERVLNGSYNIEGLQAVSTSTGYDYTDESTGVVVANIDANFTYNYFANTIASTAVVKMTVHNITDTSVGAGNFAAWPSAGLSVFDGTNRYNLNVISNRFNYYPTGVSATYDMVNAPLSTSFYTNGDMSKNCAITLYYVKVGSTMTVFEFVGEKYIKLAEINDTCVSGDAVFALTMSGDKNVRVKFSNYGISTGDEADKLIETLNKKDLFGSCSDGTKTFAPSQVGFDYSDAQNNNLILNGNANVNVAQFANSLSSQAVVRFTIENTTPSGEALDTWAMIGLCVRNGDKQVKFGVFANRFSYYNNGTGREDNITSLFSNNVYAKSGNKVEVVLARIDNKYLAYEVLNGKYKFVAEFDGANAVIQGEAVYGITMACNKPKNSYKLTNIVANFGTDAEAKFAKIQDSISK